jgi:hypothetical protein
MVVSRVVGACWLLAQAPPAKQLPPTTKAVALMALLGIALLGLLLIVFILLGGHWVRRIGSYRRGPSVPPDLVLKSHPPDSEPPRADAHRPSGETFVDDPTDDTRHA